MARRGEQAHERIMALAAYARARHGEGFKLEDIERAVPGYAGIGAEALRKKVQRDREELLEGFGIDIEWSDERQHYVVAPPVFTEEEWRALLAAAGAIAVRGVDHELGTVGAVEVVIGVNPLLSEIRDAIAERQAIEFTYQGRRRQLLPYVIGMWRNHWYVHGFDPERDATRNFRLDRIGIDATGGAITPHGEPGSYEIPPDIVPEVVFRMDPNAWGEDPPLDAVIRVEADAIPSFLDEFAEAEEWQRSLSGAVFRIRVRHYDSFLIRLIGLGTTVRLVEPEVLVARLRKWLRAQVEEA